MRRKTKLGVLVFITVVFFIGCILSMKKNYQNHELNEYHSGDSKFLTEDELIASKDGKLQILNLNTKEETPVNIESNWIDCLLNEKVIVYSNSKNQTGICQLDDENKVILNQIIFEDETLHIDPSIVKIEETYYLTSTKIQGNVNNADLNQENGLYTVQLLRSKDLKHWEYVTDIVSKDQNLEDVELIDDFGILRLIFEKESVDKKESSICMMESQDNGLTWNNEKELIPNNADNEPASFYKQNDAYYLFYSSDIENPGKSYTGASGYVTKFDDRFSQVETKKLETKYTENLLLYQVIMTDESLTLLYSHDYLNRNDLCVENIKRED